MIKADLVTSIVLMALGIATAVESWRMPRFAEVGAEPWAAPGVVPGMLGVALTLLAAILFGRSLAARRAAAGAVEVPGEGGLGRVALAVGLCVLYAGVLVGRMPFGLATFVFALTFILVFDLMAVEARPAWRRHALVAIAVAAVTAFVVPFIFQTIFLVRLP